MNGNRERKPHRHPGRVGPDGLVDEIAQFGKINDCLFLLPDLLFCHPDEGAVHVNILEAGHLVVEPCAEFEKTGHFAVNLDGAAVGDHDAGEYLQKRGLPRPVLPDDPERLAVLHFKGDVVERHKVLVELFPVDNLFKPVRGRTVKFELLSRSLRLLSWMRVSWLVRGRIKISKDRRCKITGQTTDRCLVKRSGTVNFVVDGPCS